MAASQALVLYYDPDGTAARAKGVFVRQRVRIRPVTPEQAGQRVGYLAGLRGWEAAAADDAPPAPGESVLVFSGLSGARLEAVLTALRKAGVPREVYKAVVTADNAGWSFAALCAELSRERRAVEQGEAAHGPQG